MFYNPKEFLEQDLRYKGPMRSSIQENKQKKVLMQNAEKRWIFRRIYESNIEMKYGEKAISNKCGLYDHYKDVKNISKEELVDVIEDAEEIMKYKYELGLIKAKDYIDRGIQILNNGEIDFIFFLSGITDKHKTTVLADLKKIQEDIMNEDFDSGKIKVNVKFYCAFTAGNVMFDKDILTIEQFLNLKEYRKNIIKQEKK